MEDEKIVEEGTLYAGKVKYKFFPVSHQYYIDGKRRTSVTGVCKVEDKTEVIKNWSLEQATKALLEIFDRGDVINEENIIIAINESDRILKEAGELGKNIHEWVEYYIKHKVNPKKNPMPEMPDNTKVMTGVASFLAWESEHKVKFLWSERFIYSKKHDYCGQADFGAMVDGKRCVCDIKTGNGLYNSVFVQLAGYQQAIEEESGEKYDGRWAIRITKVSEEEHVADWESKKRMKSVLGKKMPDLREYVVFDARFIDEDKGNYKADFEEFKRRLGSLNWHKIRKI